MPRARGEGHPLVQEPRETPARAEQTNLDQVGSDPALGRGLATALGARVEGSEEPAIVRAPLPAP